MSQQRTIELACPKCQSRGTFEVWSSVNRELSPDAARALAQGDLMAYRCPHCEAVTRVTYPLLLNAMNDAEMVQLRFEREPEPSATDRKILEALGGRFVLWVVSDADDLIECARLYEAGLDRWAMLLFRVGLMTDPARRGEPPFHSVRFDALTEWDGAACLSFVAFTEHGPGAMLRVPRARWESHLARVLPARERCLSRGRWTPWGLDTAMAALESLAAPPS